uniref:hypothetical protein n=1 Tax=Segatella copri TaxID=165179 RepID=UPI003FEE8D7A
MNQEQNANTQSAAEVMTIDEFHRQLVENTEAINEERMAYERKKIQLQQECDCQKDLANQAQEAVLREKFEAEQEFTRKKIHFDALERNIRDGRRKATELYLTGMAKVKSEHAMKNLELQNQRHKIFEAYRNSGGQDLRDFPDLVLKTDWTRPKPKDGGVE